MSAPIQQLSSWNQAAAALPQLRSAQTLRSLRNLYQRLKHAICVPGGLRLPAKSRRLKLQETVQFGDKRFVAILRVDGDEFLLGGGTAGISILGQLHPDQTPAPVMNRSFAAVLGSHRAQEDPA